MYNASAKTDNGRSLNNNLMAGPVIQPDVVEKIILFRLHPFVMACEITKMYRAVSSVYSMKSTFSVQSTGQGLYAGGGDQNAFGSGDTQIVYKSGRESHSPMTSLGHYEIFDYAQATKIVTLS